MPRYRDRRFQGNPATDFDLGLSLLIGPITGGPSEEDLELVWELRGEQLAADHFRAGTRVWGWWRFVAREEKPADWDAETVQLAELGELTPDEVAAIAEKANEARLRIGTGRERLSGAGRQPTPRRDGLVSVDQPAVALYEAVLAALRDA
jgi:hypothetical protein